MANLIEEWRAHAGTLSEATEAIFATANVKITDKGFADPAFLALALLARTFSNLKAALILLEVGRIVEARTITRCIFENLYWVVGLAEDGDKFVAQMRDDELSHRRSMGQTLFSGQYNIDQEVEDRLRAYMRDLNQKNTVTKMLNPKSVAGIRDDFKRTYVFYAQLSSDSAHPSVTALNRYVVKDSKGPGFDTDPVLKPREVEETYEYLSMVTLGVCVAANQIMGGTTGGEKLNACAAAHDELSNCSRDPQPSDSPA